MTTRLHILTEGDDEGTPMPDNVISFLDYFRPVGDEFVPIVMDLTVRMYGSFDLPRVAVWAHAGEDGMSPDH